MGSKVTKIEFEFPKMKVSNNDLKIKFPSYDFDIFEEKIGIQNRYISNENETSISLGIGAAQKLFNKHKINKDEIDFVIFCSQTHDYILPQSSTIIQDKLNLRNDIGTIDINHGCSGYVYGLSLAKSLIGSVNIRNVLFITSDTYSKYIHEKDRSLRSIFGDGASATLIEQTNENFINDFVFGTDGSGSIDLMIEKGGSKFKIDANPELLEYGTNNYYTKNCIHMNGPKIFEFTIKSIPKALKNILRTNNKTINEIDYFVFHQANQFMLETLRKITGIPKEKFIVDMKDYGNTVSSTIPIALSKLLVKEKKTILLLGFGVGLSWAGTIIKT